MGNNLLRGAPYVLPLLLIALIAGIAGYVTSDSEPAEIPPLSAQEDQSSGIRGTIQSLNEDMLTIATADGTTVTLGLPGESAVEVLLTFQLRSLSVGDWINGGAVAHPDTVLALVGLVLISDPVIQGP